MTDEEKRQGRRELDRAYDRLEDEVPDRLSRALRWLRSPASRWVRIPLGLFFVACSFFWFMPVVGIEFLPLGLLLLAQDIPLLRKPVARFILWLDERWRRFKRRRSERRSAAAPGHERT